MSKMLNGSYIVSLTQFFVIHVVNNFQRLSEDDLYTQLDRIYTMADEGQMDAEPIGIVTAASRDKWANIRTKLMEGNLGLVLSDHGGSCHTIIRTKRSSRIVISLCLCAI